MLLDRDEKVRWRRPLIGQSVSAIRASENVGEQGFRFFSSSFNGIVAQDF